jgi:hypothetical protein
MILMMDFFAALPFDMERASERPIDRYFACEV